MVMLAFIFQLHVIGAQMDIDGLLRDVDFILRDRLLDLRLTQDGSLGPGVHD